MTIAFLTVLLAFALVNPYGRSQLNLTLGYVLFVLAGLPVAFWMLNLSVNPPTIPLFQITGAFYALTYALPGFGGLPERVRDLVTESQLAVALAASLASWCCLVLGYWVSIHLSRSWRMSRRNDEGIGVPTFIVVIAYGFTVAANLWAVNYEWLSLGQISQPLKLFFFIWIIYNAWSGRTGRVGKALILWGLIPLEFLLFSELENAKLFGLVNFALICCTTYAVTRRRLPIVFAIAALVLFAFLQPLKAHHRYLTWAGEAEWGKGEKLVLYARLANDFYLGNGGASALSFSEVVGESQLRLNHTYTLARVMTDVPAAHPYWGGETYAPLLTKWIPRTVWPDKPREDLGNRWAQALGYLGPEDQKTSYNLPWVVEMYLNFGWIGVGVISLIVGSMIGLIDRRLIQAASGPAAFASALVISSAFFIPESNISMLLGGAIISFVVILAARFGLRFGWDLVRFSSGKWAAP